MPKITDNATKADIKDLKEEITTFRDDVMTGIDGVMKELETMREENTLGAYQTRNLREDVDGHEKRILSRKA